jgi:hypothetical protein
MIEHANFPNAMRAGRVGEAVSPRPTGFANRTTLEPVDRNLGWVLPNYAFPNLWDVGDDTLSEVRERGIEMYLHAELRLPFSPVVYMVAAYDDTFLYRVTEEEDHRFEIKCYQWRRDADGAIKLHSGWIIPHPDIPTDPAYLMRPPRIVADTDAVGRLTNSAVENTLLLTALLTLKQAEPLLEISAPFSPKLDAINRGRALGERPRLVPEARVIHGRVDEANRIV